jgi:hypothetical protein
MHAEFWSENLKGGKHGHRWENNIKIDLQGNRVGKSGLDPCGS